MLNSDLALVLRWGQLSRIYWKLQAGSWHNVCGRGNGDGSRLRNWLADSVVNSADVVRSGGCAGSVCRGLRYGDLLGLFGDSGSPRASLPGGGTVGVYTELRGKDVDAGGGSNDGTARGLTRNERRGGDQGYCGQYSENFGEHGGFG